MERSTSHVNIHRRDQAIRFIKRCSMTAAFWHCQCTLYREVMRDESSWSLLCPLPRAPDRHVALSFLCSVWTAASPCNRTGSTLVGFLPEIDELVG